MKMKIMLIGLLVSLSFSAVDIVIDPDWVGEKDGNETGTVVITNNVNRQMQIDGVRATIPNCDLSQISVQAPVGGGSSGFASSLESFDMIIGDISGGDANNNLPMNIFENGRAHTLKLSTLAVDSGKDWTPFNPQVLVLGGSSLAEKKVNKDITGITLEELEAYVNDPTTRFHDSTLYVLDTLGINGSEWGAGFIDTWVDQETEEPIWQIQVCEIPFVDASVTPVDTFRYWNENKAFLLDSLDVDDANYGATKRPFYMMGLAMTQEYMNIDMQSLMAKGFQESNAGLSMGISEETPGYEKTFYDTIQVEASTPREWTWSNQKEIDKGETVSFKGSYYKALSEAPQKEPTTTPEWDGTVFWEIASYTPGGTMIDSISIDSVKWMPSSFEIVFDKVKYSNRASNHSQGMGPMHYEESTYKGQIFEPYPKFFPWEDGKYQNSGKFINSPTGGSPLNHPAIVNAYLISTLNMWYTWQLVVAAIGEDALELMKTTPNRRLMGDMVNYAWNAGVNGDMRQAFLAGGREFLYLDQINYGINHLEDASRRSVLNGEGGDRKVYDSPIDKNTFEEFFFGEGGSGTLGIIGTNGLLHHFNLDESKRKELWSDVSEAFDFLKGKAPSTVGTDNVSFRYDYLAILRVAKSYLDLSIPVPKTEIFKNWVTDDEEVNNPIDRIAPFLTQQNKAEGEVVDSTFHKEFTVSDIADMPDRAGIRGVSWTMSGNWTDWMDATDKGSGLFDIEADKYYINKTLPADEDSAVAWVKVTDINDNELIDTFMVWRNEDEITDTDGPVITAAKKLAIEGDDQKDTLVLTINEEIKSSVESGDAKFILHNGDSRDITASTASLNGRKLTITLPQGSVTSGDSISIDASGSVEDLLGNKPDDSNKPVPISIATIGTPEFASAKMFDKDGNSTPDSLEFVISLGEGAERYTANDFESSKISIEWPRGTSLTDFTVTVVDETTIAITDFSATKPVGTGSISAELPDGGKVTGDVNDFVGPVITDASRLALSGSSEKDTVKMVISESIFQPTLEQELPSFNFHNNDTRVVECEKVYLDGAELIAIFPSGTVKIGDSISLNNETNIVDDYKNHAAENNQRIAFDIISVKTATFASANMFDSNGDGDADSVVLNISLSGEPGSYTSEDLSDLSFQWLTGSDNQTGGTVTILNESTLAITGFSISESAGEGVISATDPDDSTITGVVGDKIGAVITTALLREKMSDSDEETVTLTFSEDIAGKFEENSDYFKLNGTLENLSTAILIGTNQLRCTFPSGSVVVGDLININENSDLEDLVGNRSSANNDAVEVKLQSRPIHTLSSGAFYRDKNADGVVDRVEFYLEKQVSASRLEGFIFEFTWPLRDGSGDDTISISSDQFTIDDSDNSFITIDFVDTANFVQGMTEIGNSVASLIQPDLMNDSEDRSAVLVADGMAPVIIEAQYRGMAVNDDTTSVIDTLVITFSEQVNSVESGTQMPFQCEDNQGQNYSLEVLSSSADGSEVRYLVTVDNNSILPAKGDSIWINHTGGVIEDSYGNEQDNNSNLGVLFSAAVFRASYDVIIFPNPFLIGSTEKNPLVDNYSESSVDSRGVIAVMVRPFGQRPAKELTGKISVFDIVGNKLVDSEPLLYQERSGVLLFTTEPLNQSGRVLGNGTYRAVISITDNDNQTVQMNRLIGIKQ